MNILAIDTSTTIASVAAAFAGKNTVARHRMIYDALGELMHRDIHALAIQARSPEEL